VRYASTGLQGKHPLYVPDHGHERSLAIEPVQQGLAESEHRFDDAEYRSARAVH